MRINVYVSKHFICYFICYFICLLLFCDLPIGLVVIVFLIQQLSEDQTALTVSVIVRSSIFDLFQQLWIVKD